MAVLDPLNSLFRAFYGFGLYYEGEYSDGVTELETALRLDPDNPVAVGNLATAYHLNGMHAEVLATLRNLFPGDTELEEALDVGYAEGGYQRALLRYAETMGARPGATDLLPFMVANVYAWAGDRDRTLEWLEHSFHAHAQSLPYANQPDFSLVHGDLRYRDLRQRMGLPH